jgi:hypothetical protein
MHNIHPLTVTDDSKRTSRLSTSTTAYWYYWC